MIGACTTMQLWRPSGAVLDSKSKFVLDSAMQAQTVDMQATKLNEHYIFPDKAKQIAAVLREHKNEGKYDQMTDGEQLAKELTDDVRGVAHDLHMEVTFSSEVVPPDDSGGPPPATLAEFDQRMNFVMRLFYRYKANQRVELERLDSNIGYLKVTGFPPGFLMADKYGATMDKLADTDGLIVDLRENRGGGAESVALLISYFVDKRTRLNDVWDRDTGISTQQWTEDKLHGKRFGGKKPVIILAGPGTMSAGEDFAYTMQALKRATVIGEPTWGGANPSRPYRLGDHFSAWIPARRLISPVTGGNWEGVGVVPDIAASPDKALAVAKDFLRRQFEKTQPLVAARH